MITVYSNFYGYFYQDNAPCQKPQIILNLTTNGPQMASTVTESQSNGPPLAFSGNGKCALQICSWQISTLLLFITARKKSSDFIHPTWRLKANIKYRVQVSEHSHLTTQVCQITKITRPIIHYLISVKLNNTQTNIMVAWCQQVWSVPSSCILLGGAWATSSLPH